MKRKGSLALLLSIILALAVLGTAYALSASKVADFFGQHWNRELGESLQQGKAAQIGESVTIGNVVFTLDEIIYKDRALYGVGTAHPVRENDVIIPMDWAEALGMCEEEELLPAMSEQLQAVFAKAKASGGRVLTADSMPLKIGVDEGALLTPGCVGYYDIANEDGSVTFSFEASDGFAINEGTSYQIVMESSVWQLSEKGRQLSAEGKPVEGTVFRSEWTVSCVPAVLNTANKPVASDAGPAVIEQDGYTLLVTAAYQETGTLPVYTAKETDFTESVDPASFNQTGIASGAGTEEIRFADHAILMLSPEALFYNEYIDDHYTEAASAVIVDRAWVRTWSGHRGEFTLDKTALSGVTLEEAKAEAEAMLTRLGIDGNQYVCIEVLDLSLERIRAMGAIWEQAIADGELLVDDDYQPCDYSAIPESEEGYYLAYAPLGVDTAPAGGRYSAVFYVTSRGIVHASVRNQFTRGDLVDTPDTLITPDAAIQKLAEALGRSLSWYDKVIKSVKQAALTYDAVRAENKADGMIFVPVWMILYQDESAVRQDYDCYALINAVDGSLIDASFR